MSARGRWRLTRNTTSATTASKNRVGQPHTSSRREIGMFPRLTKAEIEHDSFRARVSHLESGHVERCCASAKAHPATTPYASTPDDMLALHISKGREWLGRTGTLPAFARRCTEYCRHCSAEGSCDRAAETGLLSLGRSRVDYVVDKPLAVDIPEDNLLLEVLVALGHPRRCPLDDEGDFRAADACLGRSL